MVRTPEQLGITYRDLNRLEEFLDYRKMRLNGVERYSWPYLIPVNPGLPNQAQSVSADDFIEIRYLSSRLVFIDLNPVPRSFDRFHDKLDTTRYFNKADLVFDPLTGFIRFHDQCDIAEDDPRLQKLASLDDDAKPELPQEIKAVFARYEKQWNGYHIFDVLNEAIDMGTSIRIDKTIFSDFLT